MMQANVMEPKEDKNASEQQEQGYNPTHRTQRLLLNQPYKEIDQQGVPLSLGYFP